MDLISNILDIFSEKQLKLLLGSFYTPVTGTAKVIFVIILGFVTIRLGSYIIRKFFDKQKTLKIGLLPRKLDTMATLLTSTLRYLVYIIVGVVILSDIFNMKSVLAAAGIGGVAIGFGAQSLVKDIISGFFIVLEDQYSVGDMVTLESMTGTVEHMELRVTKIRSYNGDLYIIPNGEIKKVTNHVRGNKAVLVDVPVAYSSNINLALEIVQNICNYVGEEFDTFIVKPTVVGITDLGKESLNLRITATTIPNTQWDVERRIRMLIAEKFKEQNIVFNDRNRIILEKMDKEI